MRKAPLTGLTTGTFDEVLVRNPPFSGSLVSVTSLGGGGGSSYDDTEVRSLISQNAAGLALKASTSALTTGLAGKQDTIADGDLSIAKTALLQSTLDGKATTADLTSGLAGKQASIQDGDLSIAKTALLQTTLDGKATTAALMSGLAGKQGTIQDGDLSIAKTALLQSTLDGKATTAALTSGLAGKQATIQDGDLSIAKTSGLQSALDDKATTSALTTGLAGKQATIQDGGLSIAKTSGLQAALDSKATTSALTTGLAGKQATLQAGSLSIAITHGLQTALDDKQDSLGVNSSGSTYLPLDKLTLPNSTVAVGSVSGQVVVTSTPHHSEVTGLATELAAKAPQASTYSKTEVDNIAAAKANQGDLLSIHDGSSFAQITQLTVNNANTTLSGTSAFVTPDALEVRAGGSAAYLACRNLEFMNHTVTAQSGTSPQSIQVIATPSVAQVTGLQSALDAKADETDLYPEVWSTSAWARLPKLYFSNADPPTFITGSNTSLPGYGGFEVRVKPTIADVTNLQTTLDEKQPLTKWSINATVGGGWYSVGATYAVSCGQLTIRSTHNIVTVQLGRVYNSLNGQKQFEVNYSGSHHSFTSIRIKTHPSSIYSWYIVQVYVNPNYATSPKQLSALWDDTCPKDHGTSASTMSIEPVDFVPDADSITTPNVGNVSSWSVGYTLSI